MIDRVCKGLTLVVLGLGLRELYYYRSRQPRGGGGGRRDIPGGWLLWAAVAAASAFPLLAVLL